MYFDRWCNSREVGTDFEKLRQVILIEEFNRFINIKIIVNKKVKLMLDLSMRKECTLTDDVILGK